MVVDWCQTDSCAVATTWCGSQRARRFAKRARSLRGATPTYATHRENVSDDVQPTACARSGPTPVRQMAVDRRGGQSQEVAPVVVSELLTGPARFGIRDGHHVFVSPTVGACDGSRGSPLILYAQRGVWLCAVVLVGGFTWLPGCSFHSPGYSVLVTADAVWWVSEHRCPIN